MTELRDSVFSNKNDLSKETIKKYQLKSIEDANKDLVEYSGWDMATPVSAVALNIEEGNHISQCLLTMLGLTDPKRIDATTVFGQSYKGDDHQIKIEGIELQKLRFRGTMTSDWLGSEDFTYVIQRPSTS